VHAPGLGGLPADARGLAERRLAQSWSFRGYADYMQSDDFADDLFGLIELGAAVNRVALMCAEAVPWRCHRSLIARRPACAWRGELRDRRREALAGASLDSGCRQGSGCVDHLSSVQTPDPVIRRRGIVSWPLRKPIQWESAKPAPEGTSTLYNRGGCRWDAPCLRMYECAWPASAARQRELLRIASRVIALENVSLRCSRKHQAQLETGSRHGRVHLATAWIYASQR
jgi:hypothetical protein